MQSIDQLIHTRWLITDQTLENHALAIHEGKILAILPSDKAKETYHAKHTENYSNHVISPGFINSHTHLAMNYFRGLGDDLTLMDWLNNYMWPAERKWVSHDFVRDASLFAMAEMIRGGTLCFNDMYFFLHATAEAAEIAGIRGCIGMTVIDFPTAWAKDFDEYFAKGLEFMRDYRHHPRIVPTLAPHAIYTVAEKNLMRVKDIAEEFNLKINMHVQETADEVSQSIEKTGLRPLKRLDNLGLVSPRLIAIHMTQINEEDLDILQAKKPHIVHCPESNMKLASGTCPVEKIKSRSLNIALGTDGAASNNDLDMISEMRTAAFLSKLSTGDATSLSAAEALQMATLNGAKALGLDDIIGSLTPGKSADFIALNLDELETLPLYHPISQIVYASSRNQVTDAWVAGKQLMKNRQLLTLDEEALKEKAKRWGRKIG